MYNKVSQKGRVTKDFEITIERSMIKNNKEKSSLTSVLAKYKIRPYAINFSMKNILIFKYD